MDGWTEGLGTDDGPVMADRAVVAVRKVAPSKFKVEMLGSAKKGSSTYYGMRIWPCPSLRQGPGSEYEVWRRWEDCLHFQGTLELEYRRKARMKRQRLQKGKGVKKNGMYLQDQASSWESLPPGPDPNSVAKEVHAYVPVLTPKVSLFRTSQATIDQRAQELSKFIEALMGPDIPALLEEIRSDRMISDFFGIWQRDIELAEKELKQRKVSRDRARSSVTSSLFSVYFPSNRSTSDLAGSGYAPSVTSSAYTGSSASSSTLRAPSIINSISRSTRTRKSSDSSDGSCGRARSLSTGSSSNYSPSSNSDTSLDSPRESPMEIPEIRAETPVLGFNYNPNCRQDPHALSALPEDREISLKDKPLPNPPPVTRRRGRSINSESAPDRNGQVFSGSQAPTSQNRLLPPERSVRESWQTVDSMACMLEGMDLTLAPSGATGNQLHRASVASVATFRTDCSADGVLPRGSYASTPSPASPPRHSVQPSPVRSRYQSFPVSVSESDDDWPESPQESELGINDILDEFFAFSVPSPSKAKAKEIPQVIVHDFPQTPSRMSPNSLTPNPNRGPPSPATSTAFSDTTTSSAPERLNIKVGYNNSFIALRVSSDIPYKDLRQRIYNKFVGVEGIPLSEKFNLSFVQHLDYGANASPADKEEYTLYPITSDGDWETVTAVIDGSKLTLRVSDKN